MESEPAEDGVTGKSARIPVQAKGLLDGYPNIVVPLQDPLNHLGVAMEITNGFRRGRLADLLDVLDELKGQGRRASEPVAAAPSAVFSARCNSS